MWNFKGTLWNSTQNILPIHWNIRLLYNIEIISLLDLRAHIHFWNAPMLNYWQFDLWEQTLVKFKSKYKHFVSRKCILTVVCNIVAIISRYQCSQTPEMSQFCRKLSLPPFWCHHWVPPLICVYGTGATMSAATSPGLQSQQKMWHTMKISH